MHLLPFNEAEMKRLLDPDRTPIEQFIAEAYPHVVLNKVQRDMVARVEAAWKCGMPVKIEATK